MIKFSRKVIFTSALISMFTFSSISVNAKTTFSNVSISPNTNLSDNLLENADFENGLTSWIDCDATMWNTTDKLSFNNTTYSAQNGKYFAWPANSKNMSSKKRATLCQDVDLSNKFNAGDKITLAGYFRNCSQTPSDSVQLYLTFFDKNDNLESFYTATQSSSSWKKISLTETIPTDACKVRVSLIGIKNNGDDNDAYFDNFSLNIVTSDTRSTQTSIPKTTTSKKLETPTITLNKTKFVYDGKSHKPTVTIKNSKGKISPKCYTINYPSNLKSIGEKKIQIKFKGTYSSLKTLTKTFTIIPNKVTNFKFVSATSNSVKLSWKKVPQATGYTIYKYSSTMTSVASTKKTSINIKNLSAGTTQKFYIKAYKKVGNKKYYSNTYVARNTTTTPAKASIQKLTSPYARHVSMFYTQLYGANGYEVWYSTSKNGKFKKLASITKYTASTPIAFKTGTTYYFKVRAFKNFSSKKYYGAFSAVKHIKVK